jgi:hypothetical protein
MTCQVNIFIRKGVDFDKWRIQFGCLLASRHYYKHVRLVVVLVIMLGGYGAAFATFTSCY